MGLIRFIQKLRCKGIFLPLNAFISTPLQALFLSISNNNFMQNSPQAGRMSHLNLIKPIN